MEQLILRQAAIDALSELATFMDECSEHTWMYTDDVYKAIKQLPPAQPEIVRCKDCKHRWTHKCMDSMPIERCDLEQTFYDAEVDYCSLAERREVTT